MPLLDTSNPPVHPLLVEHLRERFPNVSAAYDDPNKTFASAWYKAGQEALIAYLETLINNPPTEGASDEPEQTESTSTDPRRPGTRSRG